LASCTTPVTEEVVICAYNPAKEASAHVTVISNFFIIGSMFEFVKLSSQKYPFYISKFPVTVLILRNILLTFWQHYFVKVDM
jgi:hypothetical protein